MLTVWCAVLRERDWDKPSVQELVSLVALEGDVVLVGQPGCRDHVRPSGSGVWIIAVVLWADVPALICGCDVRHCRELEAG